MPAAPEVLIDPSTIAARVRELGARIAEDYRGRELRVVCVLKGSFVFAADLVRAIDVLLVEDIVDTGLTLRFLLENLGTRSPRSLKLAALLHKPARSRVHVNIDYLGFTIDDVFVVGYGLDAAQRYRNLPYVGVLPGMGEEGTP